VKAVVDLVWGLTIPIKRGRIAILQGISIGPHPPANDRVPASHELKIPMSTQKGYNLDAIIFPPPTSEVPVLSQSGQEEFGQIVRGWRAIAKRIYDPVTRIG
jgi:hypothetical protein